MAFDEIPTVYVPLQQVFSEDLAKLVAFFNSFRRAKFLPMRLDQAIKDDLTFDVGSKDTMGIWVSPDGTKLFIVGRAFDAVYEYTLPNPWSLKDIEYETQFSVAAQTTEPADVTFKPDGSRMYVASTGGVIYQYDLDTPLSIAADVTFAGSSGSLITGSIGVPNSMGMSIADNGSKLFLSLLNPDGSDDVLARFDLLTQWDVTTANYMEAESVEADGAAQCLDVMEDGSMLCVLAAAGVRRYRLDPPYVLSSRELDLSLDLSTVLDTARALRFSPDGTRMWAMGPSGLGSDIIHQWSTTKLVNA